MQMQDAIIFTKVYNAAQHLFEFGKEIRKPFAIVPKDAAFEPLNVECEAFGKEHLETLDIVIECLQANDTVGALKDRGVSSVALAEAKLFFTMIFLKYLRPVHSLDEMQNVCDELDVFIHALARLELKAQPTPPKPEPMSTYSFVMQKICNLSDAEKRIFLSMERGRRAPEFVKAWRAELPYKVSDKTFSNSLTIARNSLRAQMKRSKRKK